MKNAQDQTAPTIHTNTPTILDEHIVSGGLRTRITRTTDDYVAGQSSDGSYWILMRDPFQRPDWGFEQFCKKRRTPAVMTEPNGLVRVTQQTEGVAMMETVPSLILARYRFYHTRDTRKAPNAPIKDGRYNGFEISRRGDHYIVSAPASYQRPFELMRATPLAQGQWKVRVANSVQLRSLLISHVGSRTDAVLIVAADVIPFVLYGIAILLGVYTVLQTMNPDATVSEILLPMVVSLLLIGVAQWIRKPLDRLHYKCVTRLGSKTF